MPLAVLSVCCPMEIALLLSGKVALVTGAAGSIGQAAAVLFARQGAQVICTDIDDESGERVVASILAEGGRGRYHHMDVRSPEDVKAVVAACTEDPGVIHVLFNNVGRSAKYLFETTPDEVWHDMLEVNLSGAFITSKQVLPLMKAAGAGSIIHHASVDATFGNPSIAAYSAAKGGLIPLTHVMAHDLGKYNIRVNCISSGGIGTGRNARQGDRQVSYQSRTSVTPLQRRGRPEEVASAALFLASDMASFISGTNLTVDGGRTAITQGTYHGYD